MRNDSEILPVINVKSYPLSLPLTREGKVGGYIYIMIVVALFVVVGCDHPARVDIGELVEALNGLDKDEVADADEIADEILVDEDLSAEEDTVEADLSAEAEAEADVSDSADVEILPDTDAVEQEPDVDALEAEVEDDVPDLSEDEDSEVEGVTDDDVVVMPSNVFCSGQTKCYNNTSEITCPIEGNDFYGQDAQYAELGYCVPRDYTVSGTIGLDIVTDNNTGLEWQRTLPETYDGCTGGMPVGSTCTWQEAIDYCDSLSYSGENDWRLPNRKELATLPDYGRDNPAIDVAVFPDTQASIYWSSSPYLGDAISAYYVHFVGGYVDLGNKTDTEGYAQCVRGGALPDSTFIETTVAGKVLVTDMLTGLIWTKEYNSSVTWQNALTYCEGLDYGGATNWRLPNIEELGTLINSDIYNPASSFPAMPSEWFWSSSSAGNRSWGAGFNYGGVGTGEKVYANYARCVRD